MKVHLHQTHHILGDFEEIEKTLKKSSEASGLHLYPELFLTGYPLKDLCLQAYFIQNYFLMLERLRKWANENKQFFSQKAILMGGLDYEMLPTGSPKTIKNVIYVIDSKGLSNIYTKRLLPNYDIFDEQKYFTSGNEFGFYEIENKKFGLLICEDMWASSFHSLDPCKELYHFCQKEKVNLDGIINLSASPFDWNKFSKRLERAQEISKGFNCPFIYVNRVGAEDEILFDGRSFVWDGESQVEAQAFLADELIWETKPIKNKNIGDWVEETQYTWENLLKPTWENDPQGAMKLLDWSDHDCALVLSALKFGLSEYARKTRMKHFIVGVSGGIDSALVLAIIKLALKTDETVEAIYLPSIYSSSESYELSFQLCEKLKIPMTSVPIKFLHSSVKNLFGQSFKEDFAGITDENVQSRLRGLLLYTRANMTNGIVINTSNKSELSVGYSTQYGDSVGAISLLGDLYKTEVYRLSKYINQQYQNLIPDGIISRPPTAELRSNQKDSDSLPEYGVMDAILEGILSYRFSPKDLVQLNFPSEAIKRVFDLYQDSEYKRWQFCPILKVKSKSFGFGYRMPITKKKF